MSMNSIFICFFFLAIAKLSIFRRIFHCEYGKFLFSGMVAGYLLTRYKAAPIKITPAINAIVWSVSLGTMFLLVFGIWNGTLSLLWTALYVGVGHTGTNGSPL